MIDMSFYFDRRCEISAMLFFCGTKDNLQNSHTPTPPPPKKKKIFVLRNRFLSPSQALSVDCEKCLRHMFKCVYDVLIVSVRR